MAEGTSPGERIVIGKIVKASGIRGEVMVQPLTDFPERYRTLQKVFLAAEGNRGITGTVGVESARKQGEHWIVKFAGVDDRSAAEALVGADLEVERSEAAPLPDGKMYAFDIVGLDVVTDQGRHVGQVKEVLRLPSHDLYVVEDPQGRETMVPAVDAIVTKIDLAGRRMVIRPPEGLLPDDAD